MRRTIRLFGSARKRRSEFWRIRTSLLSRPKLVDTVRFSASAMEMRGMMGGGRRGKWWSFCGVFHERLAAWLADGNWFRRGGESDVAGLYSRSHESPGKHGGGKK